MLYISRSKAVRPKSFIQHCISVIRLEESMTPSPLTVPSHVDQPGSFHGFSLSIESPPGNSRIGDRGNCSLTTTSHSPSRLDGNRWKVSGGKDHLLVLLLKMVSQPANGKKCNLHFRSSQGDDSSDEKTADGKCCPTFAGSGHRGSFKGIRKAFRKRRANTN
uniref:Uncharacterized protein n=1 Tax=Micrurus corallinus TaxID=54390 RepID=A0A2D4EZ10_MICCO